MRLVCCYCVVIDCVWTPVDDDIDWEEMFFSGGVLWYDFQIQNRWLIW